MPEVPESRQAARREEILYMQGRNIWTVVPKQLCWDLTGKGPVSVRWVGPEEKPDRSRLVARDFKGDDKGRDDLLAETPLLAAKRMLLSKAAARREDGKPRKLLFIDAKKVHLNPVCEDDVFIELPREAGCGPDECGKLSFWLYGFRPAAAAWEKLYSSKLVGAGLVRGASCGVVFYHKERDISTVSYTHLTLPTKRIV